MIALVLYYFNQLLPVFEKRKINSVSKIEKAEQIIANLEIDKDHAEENLTTVISNLKAETKVNVIS